MAYMFCTISPVGAPRPVRAPTMAIPAARPAMTCRRDAGESSRSRAGIKLSFVPCAPMLPQFTGRWSTTSNPRGAVGASDATGVPISWCAIVAHLKHCRHRHVAAGAGADQRQKGPGKALAWPGTGIAYLIAYSTVLIRSVDHAQCNADSRSKRLLRHSATPVHRLRRSHPVVRSGDQRHE